MSHEKMKSYDSDGMISVRPTLGRFANDNTSSFITCLAEFDTIQEADEFKEKWENASNSKEVRNFLLDKHELDHPEWFRLSGRLRNDYIDYYHNKVTNEDSVQQEN
tara:strand:+ start:101 stop:418 length:318 start_codon:yes stop_codon:yes gene_type:complete